MAELVISLHFRQEVMKPLNVTYDPAKLTGLPIADQPGKFYDHAYSRVLFAFRHMPRPGACRSDDRIGLAFKTSDDMLPFYLDCRLQYSGNAVVSTVEVK